MSLTNASPVDCAKSAKSASHILATLPAEARNDALTAIHAALTEAKDDILAANARDLELARKAAADGTLSQSLVSRLDLGKKGKFEDMLKGILDVRDLEDPVGKVTLRTKLDDGLILERVTCPIGVLLIIFEARPEVIANIASLAIKSGNAAILKGGKESTESFVAISQVISSALENLQKPKVPNSAVQLVSSRDVIPQLLALDEYIDLVVPRGSNELVRYIKENTKIPVLGHADGLCSIFLTGSADPKMAADVVVDSKTSYPAACNSVETLLVQESALETSFPVVAEALIAKGVTLHCDRQSKEALLSKLSGDAASKVVDVKDADYDTEFLSLDVAVKVVFSMAEAVQHINTHGSKHTEAILTSDEQEAEKFMNSVDTAGAYWNASTRMADGMRYGFGAIVDDTVPRLSQTVITMQNRSMCPPLPPLRAADTDADDIEFYRQQAFELVEWADLMVLAPIDADNISKMMAGIADTFLLEVLRGWDTAKKILLVPGMSTHMWENPVTKRQLNKINSKWTWIRAMTPILWHYDGSPKNPKRIVNWNGFNDVLGIIKNQADLLGLGRDVDVVTHLGYLATGDPRVYSNLPPEIWTIILDYAGDWELAQALGIFTNLPMPHPWTLQPKDSRDPIKVYEHELEWLVLTCDTTAICKKLLQSPPTLHDLPALVVGLLIKFSLIDVLKWMEANRPDLFKHAFDGKVLPTKASAYFGRPDVLDYWKESKYFRGKHQQSYDAEAVDGASKMGFIQVLDWWWRHSGLPLRFTEAALEQASGKGHLLVLEWWRDAAAQDERIVLRPGKALLWAAQHGQVDVIKWWMASGIPIAHGDGVAKIASRWGQVGVLELWRKLKGDDKLTFDGEVLVQPTIHQHIGVLEWWRKFAYGELDGMEGRKQRVEYRTCDIEEALEDSIGDQEPVRKWWASNGLNLGLRNVEWMRARCL